MICSASRPGSRCPSATRRPRRASSITAARRCRSWRADGARLRLILGNAYGERAPARVFSETFYVDAALAPGARLPLPDDHEDRGIYVIEGEIAVAGQVFEAGRMLVFRPGDRIAVGAGVDGRAAAAARRRDAGGAALYLVEFRRLQPREDRGGEGGVAQGEPGSVRAAAGRPRRVHPGAVTPDFALISRAAPRRPAAPCLPSIPGTRRRRSRHRSCRRRRLPR